MKTKPGLKMFSVILSIIFLVSCGGGGGDSVAPETGNTISGVASKGLLSNSTVNIYSIDSNGQQGSLLGSTTTDSDGVYTLRIDNDGPLLVVVVGGTYTDEATGQTMELDDPIRTALPSVATDVNVAVTPLTEIAVRIAESTGGLDNTKINDANDLLSQIVGTNVVSTMPTDCNDSATFGGADVAEQNYTLLLAAISQMVETSGQELSDILESIEEDLADMEMDQTSDDLLTAVDDFLVSENNETGVVEADELVAVIEDIAENGLDPTYHLGYCHLQYRTHEARDSYQGYFSATKSGLPIAEADIASLMVKNSQNEEISLNNVGFWNGNYYRYDCRTTPCIETGPIKEGGIYGSFDTLPADTYMIKLTTTDGQTATTDITFDGPLALPVVASSSMQSQWSNGNLVLNWTNPTGEANWSEVEQIRLGLYDLEYNDVLYVYLDATDETITLPAALIQKASDLGSGATNYWQVQTRAYDENGRNDARGKSEIMPLSYSLGWSYLQYRTYENSIDNEYRFWLEVRKDGSIATASDFTNFRITDSAGNLISTEAPNFWTVPFPYPIYDCRTTPCTIDGPIYESGFYGGISSLPVGSYSLMVDTAEGTLLDVVNFPEKIELPVVSSSSLQLQEELNGDLTLNWTNPTNAPNWSEVEQLRITLKDINGNDILWVKVKPTVDTITIPASVIDDAESISGGTISEWVMQTRAYNEAKTKNIARGVSWPTGP